MGRPRKEGMDYFPHDVDASQDEKLEMMRSMYNNDGYAFYFILLERIYRSDSAEIDISSEVMIKALAKKIMVTPNRLKKMIDTSIEIKLFCEENYKKRKILTSDGIKKRFLQINSIRDKWRENKGIQPSFLNGKQGGKLGGKPVENIVENAIKESKEKKSKVKESNKTLYAENVLLFDSEYNSLVEEHGSSFTEKCIEILDNYKGQSGTKYKSDYRAILNWVVKRANEEQMTQKTKTFNTVSQKPTMTIATQEESTSDDDYQEALRIARLLDGLEGA